MNIARNDGSRPVAREAQAPRFRATGYADTRTRGRSRMNVDCEHSAFGRRHNRAQTPYTASHDSCSQVRSMNDVLAICEGLPELRVAQGDTLIAEGVSTDRLYVLKSGAFEIVRNGVRIVLINEAGAFLGEISALLGSAPTANAVATAESIVLVIDNASAAAKTRPEITYAIAQLLARRLSAVTAYLVDIKRQYADSNTHLAMMDQVLGNLIAVHPGAIKTGSERGDVPDY